MAMENQHIIFSVLQEAIRQARYKALKTANVELVNLYWQVGYFVSDQLRQSQWGEKTVQQFSDFLKKEDTTLKGFDRKSIYRMVQFYETYQSSSFAIPSKLKKQTAESQAPAVLASVWQHTRDQASNEIVATLWRQISKQDIRQTILSKISWSLHKILIGRAKSEEEREFYLRMCLKENYTVRELDRQISAGLFERTMIGKEQIPPSLKANYPDVFSHFKDSYVFEFLNLPNPHKEGDVQQALIRQMKAFILELGKDFLFVADEFRVQVGNRDFHLDLLFYHRGLQCLVAFELKNERFEPEHLGKLNFHLEALDRDVKKPHENPSIGVLLCKDKDKEVVEYALSRSLSPATVAEYKMQLPDKKLLERKLHELFANNDSETDETENQEQ